MSIVMYENECEAKENEMKTRDKIELQHINSVGKAISWSTVFIRLTALGAY